VKIHISVAKVEHIQATAFNRDETVSERDDVSIF